MLSAGKLFAGYTGYEVQIDFTCQVESGCARDHTLELHH